jgi:hypothetical protein
MLLPSAPTITRDLRSAPHLPECRLGARTPLYTVVETIDPGVSGPFFLDPAAAVLFSFYKHLSIGHYHCAPVKPGVPNPKGMQLGTRIPGWLFSRDDYQLLELRSDGDLVFESKLIDSNIDKYVNYRFGKHNPATIRTNVNLGKDTESVELKTAIGDHIWNAQRQPDISKYSTLCMIEPFVFDNNLWLVYSDLQTRTIDYSRTLYNFDRYVALQMSAASNVMVKTYFHIQETAICVVKPQELFEERSLYAIDWEGVWIHFLAMRAHNVPFQNIKAGFQAHPNLFLSKKELLSSTTAILNSGACLNLVAHCHSLRDVSAFFSTNRFYRRVYASFNIQQLILRRFLPSWSECFNLLPEQTSVERQYVLSTPLKAAGHGLTQDQGWWAVSAIVFEEDLPELNDTDGTRAASDVQRPDPNPEPKSAYRIIDDNSPIEHTKLKGARLRKLRSAQARDLEWKQQSLEDQNKITFIDYPRMEIPDHQTLSIIRSTTSFFSTACLIYSGTLASNFQEVCTLGVRVPGMNGDPPFVLSTKKSALPPTKPRSTVTTDFFNRAPVHPEYPYTVSCFSTKGTWIHRFPHPFFQDPAFVDTLSRFKVLSMYSCSLRAKFQQLDRATIDILHEKESRDWTARRAPSSATDAAVDFRTQLFLYDASDTHVLSIVYQRSIVSPFNYTMHFCFPGVDAFEKSPDRKKIEEFVDSTKDHYIYGTVDMVVLTSSSWNLDQFDILRPGEQPGQICLALTVRPNFPEPHKTQPELMNNMFYSNYMISCCLLRWYIREKAIVRGEWRTNF